MLRFLRALLDGLLLRCPRCHTGRMFARGFTMNPNLPELWPAVRKGHGRDHRRDGHQYRRNAGDHHRLRAGVWPQPAVPLGPLLIGLALFAILFPIAFYRSSRGLWAGFLYITGDNQERD